MFEYFDYMLADDMDVDVVVCICDGLLKHLYEKEIQEENQRRAEETFGLDVVN